MLENQPVVVAGGAAALVALVVVLAVAIRRRRRSDVRQSRERHRNAQRRDPPVDIGDVHTLGVTELTTHHSGETHAVGKVEGFVIFVDDVPGDVRETDVIRVKIHSFNRNHTSASATYLGSV